MGSVHRASIVLVGALLLAGCGEPPVPPAEAPPPAPVATDVAERLEDALALLTPTRTEAQFARSCAFCHATGNGGAPLVGDEGAWRARAAGGEDQLLRHTLEGLGAMPPLGYCMDCTEADFRALIRFLLPPSLRGAEGEA